VNIIKELTIFLTDNDMVILGADKGKGHCLCSRSQVEMALDNYIEENYKIVHLHHSNKLKYLNYRETAIRNALLKLKKSGTITDKDYKSGTHQQSQITNHVLTCKIHKFKFITESKHGNGIPITSPEFAPGTIPVKFRTISPLQNAPSSRMGKVLGEVLENIQNSGIRLTGIGEIVKNIQDSIAHNNIAHNEEIVSFDCVSMYDSINLDLVKWCLNKRKFDFF